MSPWATAVPVLRAPDRPCPKRFGMTMMRHDRSSASSSACVSSSGQWSMTRTISSAASVCFLTDTTACFRSSHLSMV